MITEITKNVNAIPIQLDEKKCGTMKVTIELIQMKLRTMFGYQSMHDDNYGSG